MVLLPFAMAGTAQAGLNDGLAGYWTFDEGVGIVANDVTGNGNTGAIINGATFVPGHSNTGLSFNGTNQFVSIPDFGTFTQFSVGAFVTRTGATTAPESVISYKEGNPTPAAQCGFTLRANDDGSSQAPSIFAMVGGAWKAAIAASPLPLGVETHIAGTYDGSTLKLFVNGVLAASTPAPGTLTQCPQVTSIGGRATDFSGTPGSSDWYFPGSIDEVHIYDRALADCEVARLAGDTAQCLVPAVQSPASPSQEYLQLDTELTQDIVVDDQQTPGSGTIGMAWLPNGHLIRKAGNQVIEYTTDQTRNVFSTPVYDIVATHTVSGLDSSGQGITNGLDGYVYSNSPNGLWRIDVNTWTAVKVGTHGYWYGIGTLPDGRIVNQANTAIYIYDPVTSTQSLLYNPGLFVDDLTTTSDGLIALAMRYNNSVRIIDASGTLVNTANVHTTSGAQPDGMAFGGGSLYTANTDGTISRFDFDAPGIVGGASHEVIVAAQGGYGDLASVGPDGAFYISIRGIRYDDGTGAPNWGIVRISIPGGFDTPPGVPANKPPVADAGAAQTVECTGSSSANVTLDGSASTDPDSDPLTYSWTWSGGSATGVSPSASFPLGTTAVTLTVDDGQGHTATAGTVVTVEDTTAPTVSAGLDVTLEATSLSGAGYDVSAQASASDTCCAVATSITPAGPYALGSTTVTVSATDCSGNTASDTMVVTVVDTTAPVLTPPADVTAEANAVSSTVSIGSATATDIFPVSIGNNAPATYPLGTTLVTWTATDANGNTSSATQSVTVVDTTAPVLSVPVDVTAEANAVSSTVSIGSATATDIFPVTISSDAPGTFPLGTTLVTWTATDANGNSSSGTQNVTVVDTTPPALTVPVDVTVEATGVLTPVAIGTATGTDIFLPVTITNDAPASYPLGTTLVTWTATDANGNVSTATQNVTVQDTTPPTVTAQLIPVSSGHDEDEHHGGHDGKHGGSGLFQVVFSASDIVDPNPVLTATLNGATVSNGQIVKLERSKKAEVETEHGTLEISGLSFTLDVSATDASGNTGTASDSFTFPSHRGDDHGIHRGNDREDKHADSGKHKSEGKTKVGHKDNKKSKKKGKKSRKHD